MSTNSRMNVIQEITMAAAGAATGGIDHMPNVVRKIRGRRTTLCSMDRIGTKTCVTTGPTPQVRRDRCGYLRRKRFRNVTTINSSGADHEMVCFLRKIKTKVVPFVCHRK